jgi:hypothetical protein
VPAGPLNGDKVISRLAQQIAQLSAENAMLATALEEAQERLAELEPKADG